MGDWTQLEEIAIGQQYDKKEGLVSLLYLGRLSKFDCINAYAYEGTCILRQDKFLRLNPPYVNGPKRSIVFGI